MEDGRAGRKPLKHIAIYVEGGGDSTATKAAIRRGFDAFLAPLKEEARRRSIGWKVVACGPRNETRKRFLDASAQRHASECVLLLVDAEAPVGAPPRAHLQRRDGWDLGSVAEEDVHLMVQVSETWLVADADAVARYYGSDFRRSALPAALDLETVPKADIAAALDRATQDTQKGKYHKINHASDLLAAVDPEEVRKRCGHCGRLLDRLAEVVRSS